MNIQELTNQINTEENLSKLVESLKNGRLTSQPQPKTSSNIAELFPDKHKINDPFFRPDKDVVRDVPDGKGGTKTETKKEKVTRISLALQKLIVKRAVAFVFGNEPLLNTSDEYTDVLSVLQKVFSDCKIKAINRKTARELMSYQEVAEHWYIDPGSEQSNRYGFQSKNRIRCTYFSPSSGDTLYPYFDEYNNLIAFSREYSITQSDKTSKTFFETWTAEWHYKWERTTGNFQPSENYPQRNVIGKIPIIYAYQSQTEWADVQNLIERLEKLLSNFGDTNDYHGSPMLFTKGRITGFATKGESGRILQGTPDSSIEYISWAQAPEATKTEVEMLLRMIYTITQTPDISFDSVKGIGSISGTALRLLFADAHLKVQEKSEVFDEFLQRRNNVILAYLSTLNVADNTFTNLCKNAIVTAEIQPYLIEDDTTKISQLMTATGNKAIMSRKTAVKTLGWVSDTDTELEDIEADEAGANMADLMTPTE